MAEPKTAPPSCRRLRLGVVMAALLVLAGGLAFYLASQGRKEEGAHDVSVTVTAKACEPNELGIPAGKRSFEIRNASDRPVEWEILDGVMVVAERENIAPGFRQTLSARLTPGDYEMTCGLLSNPRGRLRVAPSEEAAAAAATPSLRALLGPLAEYKFYLIQQGGEMLRKGEALAAAIKAGNLADAQSLYEPARLPYKRIEALAYRFADLENAIDPLADYLAGREADPAFTGYHRLEYGLFAARSLEGLEPLAEKLVADLGALKDRLRSLDLTPGLMTESPGALADQLVQGRILAGEEHYAQTDLADLAANLEGIARVVALLQPVLEPADPALAAELQANLTATRDALEDLRQEGRFPPYDTLDQAARDDLNARFASLAQSLNRLPDTIGLN